MTYPFRLTCLISDKVVSLTEQPLPRCEPGKGCFDSNTGPLVTSQGTGHTRDRRGNTAKLNSRRPSVPLRYPARGNSPSMVYHRNNPRLLSEQLRTW